MDLLFGGWKEVSHLIAACSRQIPGQYGQMKSPLSALTTLVTFLSTVHTHFLGKGHQEGLPADLRWKLGAQV